VPVIILVAMVLLSWAFMSHTVVGRSSMPSQQRCGGEVLGLQVKRIQISAFVITSFSASLAGIILMGARGLRAAQRGSGIEMDPSARCCWAAASPQRRGGIGPRHRESGS